MKSENDNQKELPFYSYRNVSKCLSAGISFLTDNFLHLIKLSLPITIPFTLVFAASIYLSSDATLFADPMNLWMSEGVLSFLLLLLSAAFVGFIYNMVRMKSEDIDLKTVEMKDSYKQPFFKLTVNALIVSLIFIVVTGGFCYLMMKSMLREAHGMAEVGENIAITSLLFLIMIAVFIPSGFCLPNVELGEGTLMSKFWKGYKVGWKKWGKLFALSLLVSIIVGIISLLLMSPAIVITLLQRNASLSLLEGDAVNLPSLFPLWAVLILIISAFLLTIVTWIQHLPLAYLYAAAKEDMEQEEKSKLPMI